MVVVQQVRPHQDKDMRVELTQVHPWAAAAVRAAQDRLQMVD